jgi:hypothetical protein
LAGRDRAGQGGDRRRKYGQGPAARHHGRANSEWWIVLVIWGTPSPPSQCNGSAARSTSLGVDQDGCARGHPAMGVSGSWNETTCAEVVTPDEAGTGWVIPFLAQAQFQLPLR